MTPESKDFEEKFIHIFKNVNRSTLFPIKKDKIRIELGGSLIVPNRIQQALDRSRKVIKSCFEKYPIWLRIIIWDTREKEKIKATILKVSQANLFFEDEYEGEKVLYVYYELYNEDLIHPIVLSIINFETGGEPFANITCYFINFISCLILNIYDDRGMDLFSPNEVVLKEITDKYNDWIIG